MDQKMFCFQCEQTAGCAACTGRAGVCGKTADVAGAQDGLTGAMVALARTCQTAGAVGKNTYKCEWKLDGTVFTLTQKGIPITGSYDGTYINLTVSNILMTFTR